MRSRSNGCAAVLTDEVLGQSVELAGGDSRLRELAEQRNGAGDDDARTLHALDLGS